MGTWQIWMKWDEDNYVSEYVVQVVGVESQSLVGHYSVGLDNLQGPFTKMTGHFPIRCIEKMEKIA